LFLINFRRLAWSGFGGEKNRTIGKRSEEKRVVQGSRVRRNVIYYNIICYYIPWIVLQSVTVYSAVLAVRRGAPAAIYIYVCIPSTPLIPTIYICVGFCKVAGALNIHKHMFDIIIYFALSRPRSTCKLQRETRWRSSGDTKPVIYIRQSTINKWTAIRAFVCVQGETAAD